MLKRKLWHEGPVVTSLGLGCMGIAEFYEKTDAATASKVIHQALDMGVNYFDTADMYGCGKSEIFLENALKEAKHQIILSSKFGFVRDTDDVMSMKLNGSPEYVQMACENSLKRLKRDYLDVLYLHRVDPNIPIEETIGAMKRLVEAGKIRAIGMSDTTTENLRRAVQVHPIACYQAEYSLWHRNPEKDLMGSLNELNITFVPYSPLGRGFLTGKITRETQFDGADFRKVLPRFQAAQLEKNLALLDNLKNIAREKCCTLAQLSLAWLLHKLPKMVPIPGATSVDQVIENHSAVHICLSLDDIKKIEECMPIGCAVGSDYPEEMNVR